MYLLSDDSRHWAFQPPVARRLLGPRETASTDSYRCFRSGAARKAWLVAFTGCRRSDADSASDIRSHWLATDTGSDRPVSRKPIAGAYEQYVDELLASPRYGERWARHWLDAAGYADSEGVLAADVIRANAWRYRDYVIRSLNSDKPYDQFVREQLAGDESRSITNTTCFQAGGRVSRATGFCALLSMRRAKISCPRTSLNIIGGLSLTPSRSWLRRF